MELFLKYLDQFRYISGLLLIVFLLCHKALSHRSGYHMRLTVGYLAALLLALGYVPIARGLDGAIHQMPAIMLPYWLLMSLVPIGFVLFCYDVSLPVAMVRCIMGSVCESTATVLLRDLFVAALAPDLPQTHPVLYIAVMVGIYALVYLPAYAVLGRLLWIDEENMYPNTRSAGIRFLASYLGYAGIIASSRAICERVILTLKKSGTYVEIYHYVQNHLIFEMLLIGFVMGIITVAVYRIITLQNEKQVITQMAQDRKTQYEFSREHIEMINRKAHDLKHQLRALEQVTDEERKAQLQETMEAVDFYDAVVKTGIEALDTILTEKSVYCMNRGIRLSCTVSTQRLDHMGMVDLYTLLGNAIDNAIEGVDQLSDPEKKTISLTIRDQGQMLFFHVENYFKGDIRMRDGLPQTTKPDEMNHGFGIRSIRSIAQRYGGKAVFSTRGQIFSLEVLIPT